jgi:hypothetical protein
MTHRCNGGAMWGGVVPVGTTQGNMPCASKSYFHIRPIGLGKHGLVQQTDQIVARFAITIYP